MCKENFSLGNNSPIIPNFGFTWHTWNPTIFSPNLIFNRINAIKIWKNNFFLLFLYSIMKFCSLRSFLLYIVNFKKKMITVVVLLVQWNLDNSKLAISPLNLLYCIMLNYLDNSKILSAPLYIYLPCIFSSIIRSPLFTRTATYILRCHRLQVEFFTFFILFNKFPSHFWEF